MSDHQDQTVRDGEREITIELLRLLNDARDTESLAHDVTALLQACSDCDGVVLRWKDGERLRSRETCRGGEGAAPDSETRCAADGEADGGTGAARWMSLECLAGRMLQGEPLPASLVLTAAGSFWTNDMSATGLAEGQGGAVISTHHCRAAVAQSMALVPLRQGGGVLGVLELYDRAKGRFSAGFIAFLENIAGQTAIALAQREATAALARSERRLSDISRAAGEFLWDCDLLARTIYMSPRVTGILGYLPEELIGHSFFERMHPDDLPKTRHQLQSYLGSGAEYRDLEFRIIARDGRPVWLSSTGVPVFDGAGVLVGYRGAAQDITERKQAESRLRRLKKAVDQAAEAIVVTATDGSIEYVNPAFERASGYSAAEVLGQKPGILRSGQHDEEFYRAMWATISGGNVWSGRIVNRRKNGTLYTEECTIAPVKDEHAQIERFVAVKRDVSREIELETQFRQAQKLESVGRLAAGVAHDLNNLLSPILGYAELLLRESPDVGPLREIAQAAERSRDLVRQLLAFARKQVLETRLLDLREIAAGMERLLRPTLRENIDLRFFMSGQSCAASVDKGQVEQVLMNLVVNAQDAMPDGGTLSISVAATALREDWCRAHPGATPGNYVCLRVTDTGQGMTPEVRAQVFEPFFTTKGLAGTGLGLSTVYGIVSQHGGYVFLDSEVGRGTTASVYFPAAAQPAPISCPEPVVQVSPKGSEVVLVVEDNQQVRRLAVMILQRHGYIVETATSGAEAIAIAEAGAPIDLLLTDVVMPGMNGRELHEHLLRMRPTLGALFMSGYTPDVLGHQGVLDEGLSFLRKPFTVSELATKVREVLDRAR